MPAPTPRAPARAGRQSRTAAGRGSGARSGSGARGSGARRSGPGTYLAILAFLIGFIAISLTWPLPYWVAGLYLAVSILSFVVYAVDKSAAGTGRRRVPERTLLLLGFAGGWPGAIVAQQMLRHKTQKASFRRAFWVSVLANVAVFVALATPLVAELASFAV